MIRDNALPILKLPVETAERILISRLQRFIEKSTGSGSRDLILGPLNGLMEVNWRITS